MSKTSAAAFLGRAAAYASAITPTRLSITMVAGISITLGVMFLFILTVDFPFTGEFSVPNRLLANLGSEFSQLDQIEWRGGG